jgi:hypothetical protein
VDTRSNAGWRKKARDGNTFGVRIGIAICIASVVSGLDLLAYPPYAPVQAALSDNPANTMENGELVARAYTETPNTITHFVLGAGQSTEVLSSLKKCRSYVHIM